MKLLRIPLGIIELANRPLNYVGNVGNPLSYPYDVLYETAADAYVSRIVQGDAALADRYAEAAQRLVARGARAIMSTCGFAVLYQGFVAARTPVPTLLSPLSRLPQLLHQAENSRVAVLTYDSRHLDEKFYAAAGVSDRARVIVAGIEGSATWRALGEPSPTLDPHTFERDVESALARALQHRPAALLVECSAFCPLRERLARRSGLPVFDFLNLADELVGATRGTESPSRDVSRALDDWRYGPDAFGFSA